MDIDLLKTFLEVNRTRHFGHAAENLYLTQSAVSARIRLLEEALGVSLFTRTRNDIQLTAPGGRLVKYAETILNSWHRARQETALGAVSRTVLAIGGVYSLWDALLQEWAQALRGEMPGLVLQVYAHDPERLVRKLIDGSVDVGFMPEPPSMAELLAREVGRLNLIMVAREPGLTAEEAVTHGYVMTDWGALFAMAHARHFPEMPPPSARVDFAPLALGLLLSGGGAAYLPERTVSEYLRTERLHRVHDAPVVDHPVFAVYPVASDRRALIERSLVLFAPPPAPARDAVHTATVPAL